MPGGWEGPGLIPLHKVNMGVGQHADGRLRSSFVILCVGLEPPSHETPAPRKEKKSISKRRRKKISQWRSYTDVSRTTSEFPSAAVAEP